MIQPTVFIAEMCQKHDNEIGHSTMTQKLLVLSMMKAASVLLPRLLTIQVSQGGPMVMTH